MKIEIKNRMHAGEDAVISASFIFPLKEFSLEEAEAIVKGFQAPTKPAPSVMLSPIQAEINKQMGVSAAQFAKYNAAS